MNKFDSSIKTINDVAFDPWGNDDDDDDDGSEELILASSGDWVEGQTADNFYSWNRSNDEFAVVEHQEKRTSFQNFNSPIRDVSVSFQKMKNAPSPQEQKSDSLNLTPTQSSSLLRRILKVAASELSTPDVTNGDSKSIFRKKLNSSSLSISREETLSTRNSSGESLSSNDQKRKEEWLQQQDKQQLIHNNGTFSTEESFGNTTASQSFCDSVLQPSSFNLEDGKILNKHSFLCIGSTYFEHFSQFGVIRTALTVPKGLHNNQTTSTKPLMITCVPSRESHDDDLSSLLPTTTQRKPVLPVDVDQGRVVNSREQTSRMQSMAISFLQKSFYENSLELWEEILLCLTETYGPNHILTAHSLHNCALVHLLIGSGEVIEEKKVEHYNQALQMFQEAIDVFTYISMGKKRNPDCIPSFLKMGMTYYALREYTKAQTCFQEAATCFILPSRNNAIATNHGPDHPRIAEAFNNLACVYYEKEQYDLSLRMFEKSKGIQKKSYLQLLYSGDNDNSKQKDILLGLSAIEANIGFVHLKQLDFEKAIQSLEEALSQYLLILDETDTLVMILFDNLAFANLQYGCEEAALKLFQRLLFLQTRALGPYDVQCAVTYTKLSRIHMKHHQLKLALDCIKNVLECQCKNRDEDQQEMFAMMVQSERNWKDKIETTLMLAQEEEN